MPRVTVENISAKIVSRLQTTENHQSDRSINLIIENAHIGYDD